MWGAIIRKVVLTAVTELTRNTIRQTIYKPRKTKRNSYYKGKRPY